MYTCIPFLLTLPPTPSCPFSKAIRAVCWVSVLCSTFPLAVYVIMAVYICQAPFVPISLQPRPQISSLHLCLYSCCTHRFICTTFLDSTYINCYSFFFFFLRKHRISQAQMFMSCPTSPLAGLLPKEQAQLKARGMCWGRVPLLSRALGFSSLHSQLLANAACWVGVQLFAASHYSPLDFYMVRMVSPLCSWFLQLERCSFFFLGQTN